MTNLLYVSRGRGFGHAIPDLVAARSIRASLPNLHVTFASYASGLKLLAQSEFPVLPLHVDLAAEFDPCAMIPALVDLFDTAHPDIVVAHEMFFVPLIARSRSIPSILLTHWFFTEVRGHPAIMRDVAMTAADRIVLLDLEQFHKTPEFLVDKVQFIAPILRFYDHKRVGHHPLPREPLKYALIAMGGRSWRFKNEIDMVLAALAKLQEEQRFPYGILLLAPGSANYFRQRGASLRLTNLTVLDHVANPAALYRDALFVVGRGSYITMAELAVLGVPSLHIVSDDNPVDLFHARNFENLGTLKYVKANITDVYHISILIEQTIQWSKSNRKLVAQAGEIYRVHDAPMKLVEVLQDILRD